MTSKWLYGLFPVKTPSGETSRRVGYFRDGWGIHKQPRGPFIVTHLPTGARLPFEFARRGEAQAFVARIEPLADWQSLKEADPGLVAGTVRAAGVRVQPRLAAVARHG